MKVYANFVLLLAAIASVSASPAIDPEDVAASGTVEEGEFLYVGADVSMLERRGFDIEKRCCCAYLSPHADCTAGQCQCLGDYGCWSCNGGRTQCQPGPGSGQCWT